MLSLIGAVPFAYRELDSSGSICRLPCELLCRITCIVAFNSAFSFLSFSISEAMLSIRAALNFAEDAEAATCIGP